MPYPSRVIGTVALILAGAIASVTARKVPTDAAAPPVPTRLSDTGLYVAGRVGVVAPGNRPFSPQYPLWSDGATKTRWVFLPQATTIDARDDAAWEFPVGTRFWKEFTFNGRKVETRMLWKATAARWVAVSYIWNDAQTDALLAPEQGQPGVIAIAPGRFHGIPSATDCLACHGAKRTGPLGFNALQLSTDRDPQAIHREPLAPGMITTRTLVEEGRLASSRPDLLSSPPRIRTRSAHTRRMLGYFVANCGSCHNGNGEIAVLGPSMKHSDLLRDGDAVARSLVGHATKWQVPGVVEGSVLIDPATPQASAMLVRMRSRSPSSQMPPLGTVLRDQEAVDALTRWIAHDLAPLSTRVR